MSDPQDNCIATGHVAGVGDVWTWFERAPGADRLAFVVAFDKGPTGLVGQSRAYIFMHLSDMGVKMGEFQAGSPPHRHASLVDRSMPVPSQPVRPEDNA